MNRNLTLIILFILLRLLSNAQIITTIASGLTHPYGLAIDASGYVYASLFGDNQIRKINISTGSVTIIAGTPIAGYNGDGIVATSAQLNNPIGIAIDNFGNIYIADKYNYRIRKVDKITGLISTVVGTGVSGYNGDGILATSAQILESNFVSIDKSGNIYIADGSRIRKIDKTSGIINTVVGTGTYGYNGDGISAVSAKIRLPEVIDFDEFGNIIFFDDMNFRLRKVTISTGIISTIAGTGVFGPSGDGGLATVAQLGDCEGLAIDGLGNIYIADSDGSRIRKIDKITGIINSIAGGGSSGLGDGGLATFSQLVPLGIAIDNLCNMYIADDAYSRIRKIENLSNCVNSIEELTGKIAIDFYPNPLSKMAILKVKDENIKYENLKLNILDAFGRKVKTLNCTQNNEIIVDRENLDNGIYFYQLVEFYKVLATGKFIID